MFYTNDKGYQQILRDAIQYRILRRTLTANSDAEDSAPPDDTDVNFVGLSRVLSALSA
jgi:hypothetical protein